MNTYVIGDQHGGFKAVKQVIERCDFDYETDLLVNLGDVVDGFSECAELVEYWLEFSKKCKIKPIFIRGNHDWWFQEYLTWKYPNNAWLSQGGRATYESYIANRLMDNKEHIQFFENQVDYYIDNQNRLFVHGGFESTLGVEYEDPINNLHWDRSLFNETWNYNVMKNSIKSKLYKPVKPKRLDLYNEIYIGHTSCYKYNNGKPVHIENLINLDTGGGWEGVVTIMNADTKEYWQSDIVKTLYPNEKGRY